MKQSKRLVSLILVVVMLLGVLPTTALADDHLFIWEDGKVNVVVKVYDWDKAVNDGEKVPVPNLEIELCRRGSSTGLGGVKIASAFSDEQGIANILLNVTSVGSRTYPVGQPDRWLLDTDHVGTDNIQNPAYAFFDVGPVATSAYEFNTSIPRYIRNYLIDACCSRISKTGYDDFTFTKWVDYRYGEVGKRGAGIDLEIYVKAKDVTLYFENDHIKNFDQTYYPSQTVKAGQCFTEPSGMIEHDTNTELQFMGWKNKETGEAYDFSKPATASVTLVPNWYNPNIAGYVHLDSFLWDHEANDGSYGSGRTDTTVNDLTYVVEYYDQAVATTTKWNKLCEVTVDEYGQADFVITQEMLAEIRAFKNSIINLPPVNGEAHNVAIDIGPALTDKGWHTQVSAQNNYAWDWIHYNHVYEHGAGVTGVRYMMVNTDTGTYNGIRDDNTWVQGKQGDTTTPRIGNVQYASNLNHVPWVTEDMLDNGFEIYWTVYVTPSMTVKFDLDGGSGAGDYSDQHFEPINSLPETNQNQVYKVTKPVNNPTRYQNETFIGWYKVIGKDSNDEDILEGTQWDFANRLITESMTLKAVYGSNPVTVVFDPKNGEAVQSHTYVVDDTPAWTGPDPVKASTAATIYKFEKWVETTGVSINSDYFFKDEYDMDHTARVIYDDTSDTDPVQVTNSFAPLTVYEAQYEEIPTFHVVHHAVHGDLPDKVDDIPLSAVEDFFDITKPLTGEYAEYYEGVREGYIYGGMYTDENYTTAENWQDGNELCGIELEPEAGDYFYLREVSNEFLQPRIVSVRRHNGDKQVERYLLTVIDGDGADKEFYSEYGFIYDPNCDEEELDDYIQFGNPYKGETEEIYDVSVDEDQSETYDSMTCILYEYIDVYKNGVKQVTQSNPDHSYVPTTVFSNAAGYSHITDDDYFGCLPYNSDYEDRGSETAQGHEFEYDFHYTPYYVTADGVFVSGIYERYTDISKAATVTAATNYDELLEDGSLTYLRQECAVASVMVACCFAANPDDVDKTELDLDETELDIDEPESDPIIEQNEVTVTIHAEGETEVVAAEPGDFRDLIEAPEIDGQRFAGWYADEDYTVPADFTDVREDMDVYARYIDNTYFTVKMINSMSKKVVTKTKVITVVDDRDLYQEVGFEITIGNETMVYALNKDYASVSGYSPVKLYDGVDKHSRLIYQTITLSGVADGTEIVMVPYYITADGSTIYGESRTATYRVNVFD